MAYENNISMQINLKVVRKQIIIYRNKLVKIICVCVCVATKNIQINFILDFFLHDKYLFTIV